MEDKSKVIFGNEMSKKTYKKAMQSKKKYVKRFGDDSDIDLSISFELKYNFISSILREIMSKYLANLAVGINSILYNAGLMMTYSTTDPMNKALGIKCDEVIDPYIFDDWSKIDL